MTTCVFNINKRNVFGRPTQFARQPQQGLVASSVGCWPPPWRLRPLPQLLAVPSLEWGGDRRRTRRSRRSAVGEPPCKLDGHMMHRVKNPLLGGAASLGSPHRRRPLTWTSSHRHTAGLTLALPPVDRIVRYSRDENGQLSVGVSVSVISHLQVERDVIVVFVIHLLLGILHSYLHDHVEICPKYWRDVSDWQL